MGPLGPDPGMAVRTRRASAGDHEVAGLASSLATIKSSVALSSSSM